MTPIEIIAVVFSIVILIRTIVLFCMKPERLMKFVEKLFKRNGILTGLFLAVAVFVGYYLLQELTISQVIGGILLGVILVGLAIVQFPQEFMIITKSVLENKRKIWLAWTIFVLLAIWALLSVFGAL